MIKRPMLANSQACTEGELKLLSYPVILMEKLDGIRCTTQIQDATVKPFSRKNIVLPNCHIYNKCTEDWIPHLDGEIIVEGWTFHEIQSKVMSDVTLPFEFRYLVFDHLGYQSKGYLQRLQILERVVDRYNPERVYRVPYATVNTPSKVMRYYESVIAMGGEGIIIRDPYAPYKQGRSTLREQGMLKMKEFEDAEAEVIGYEEAEQNNNEKSTDNTGYSKRSSHQSNKRGKGYLGVLIGRDLKTSEIIRVGSGFDRETANHVWQNRGEYSGAIFTYKFQRHGTKDKPRTPIFKGFRRD